MVIDDELLVELLKPDRLGEIGDGALIIKVVGTKNFKYKLEEPTHFWRVYKKYMPHKREVVKIRPDITVTLPREGHKQIAIELENDIQWDFQKSLQQVKKYKEELFEDTRVIVPEEYIRFAPLYKHEGFRVFLWSAKRKWKCLRCKTITLNESRIPPRCSDCSSNSRSEFDLVGLKDADINEY